MVAESLDTIVVAELQAIMLSLTLGISSSCSSSSHRRESQKEHVSQADIIVLLSSE